MKDFAFDLSLILTNAAMLACFFWGAHEFRKRVFPKSPAGSTAASFISTGLISLMGLLWICYLVELISGFRSLWLLVLGVQSYILFGCLHLWRHRSHILNYCKKRKKFIFTGLVIWLVSAACFVRTMVELATLPSFHDGMAHLGFATKILESGHLLLNNIPMDCPHL